MTDDTKSTVDTVVLALVGIVGFVVVVSLVGIIVLELARPHNNISGDLIQVESEVVGVLVGALVGFVGGRGSVRRTKEGE